ncbi:CoA-binding protein [Lichenihabitans psoromatis]|uniref:CoA-binding protein n=1 Tax=Lichenihabitans psoromatis TaxID=2528642 RepID=UPI0010384C2C|nr:CoA-binding protein [Lichenihabitans psoromatis]
MQDHDDYSDAYLRDILLRVKTIAVVGASDKPRRPSYGVMQFLAAHHYKVVAINPALPGSSIGNIPIFAQLADVPHAIDMVDIFRNNAAIDGVVDEVLALETRPSVIWMQLDIRVDAAARRAEQRGLQVVMNRCPKIEYWRLIAGE